MKNQTNRQTLYRVFSNCINSQNQVQQGKITEIMKEVMREVKKDRKFEISLMKIEGNNFQLIIRKIEEEDIISKTMGRIKNILGGKCGQNSPKGIP